jgi:diguanylate cyclase (GGDEF)-like protein
MRAALRRLLRRDVIGEPSQEATDPRAGSRVAVAFPATALMLGLGLRSSFPSAGLLTLGPWDVILLAGLASLYGRFPVKAGPRTVFTFEMPAIVLAGLLGGPLAGALVGASGGASDANFVWRRNAAYGGLGACSGALAGYAGLAWHQGALTLEMAAVLAASAHLCISVVGRMLVQLDRRVPGVTLFCQASIGDLVEAVVATPLLVLLASSYGERRALVLVVLASGAAVLLLIVRALDLQRLAQERERRASLRDWLTGAAGRGAFEEALEREWQRVLGGAYPAGLLVLDVDHFKIVNDTHRHAGGDRVLRQLVERLAASVRENDLLARWGGEELCVLAPAIGTLGKLESVAEELRAVVAGRPFLLPGDEMTVTVSIGGTLVDGSLVPSAAFERADEALYLAKRRRDTVCILPPWPKDAAVASPSRLALSS